MSAAFHALIPLVAAGIALNGAVQPAKPVTVIAYGDTTFTDTNVSRRTL
jgi:hypothetical protein